MLHHVCYVTALEALCAKKDEELSSKEQMIEKLENRLRTVEEVFHRELTEYRVQAQQDAYVASHFGLQEAQKKRRNMN